MCIWTVLSPLFPYNYVNGIPWLLHHNQDILPDLGDEKSVGKSLVHDVLSTYLDELLVSFQYQVAFEVSKADDLCDPPFRKACHKLSRDLRKISS